jgi:hypothetical protein
MVPSQIPPQSENYVMEDDRFVLYVGSSRVLSTDAIAVLVDTRLGMIITHGDPESVRRELDEMRALLRTSRAPQYEEDWLLLEGHPDIQWLNTALRSPAPLVDLERAFAGKSMRSAADLTRRLLERVSRRH